MQAAEISHHLISCSSFSHKKASRSRSRIVEIPREKWKQCYEASKYEVHPSCFESIYFLGEKKKNGKKLTEVYKFFLFSSATLTRVLYDRYCYSLIFHVGKLEHRVKVLSKFVHPGFWH